MNQVAEEEVQLEEEIQEKTIFYRVVNGAQTILMTEKHAKYPEADRVKIIFIFTVDQNYQSPLTGDDSPCLANGNYTDMHLLCGGKNHVIDLPRSQDERSRQKITWDGKLDGNIVIGSVQDMVMAFGQKAMRFILQDAPVN